VEGYGRVYGEVAPISSLSARMLATIPVAAIPAVKKGLVRKKLDAVRKRCEAIKNFFSIRVRVKGPYLKLGVQLENVQRLIDRLVKSLPNIAGQMGQCGGASMEKTAMKKTPSSKSQSGKKKKKKLPLALSGTMNRYFFLSVCLFICYLFIF